MKTRLIDLGNSKAIELPPSILAQTGITENVEIIIKPQGIMIYPIGKFKKNHKKKYDDSSLLDEEFLSGLSSDDEDWVS
ncbi:MAG: hypothetical protein WD037_04830 [Balneolales bacterium]